jgi:predicted DNA-binding transcriptional regulator YafY
MTNEPTRNAGLDRTLRLVADLLSGRPHDRHSAAKLLSVKEAAAARQLQAIADRVPGMEWDHSRRPKALRFVRSQISSAPDFSSAIAACFGLTLAPLFEGTAQQSGMRRAFSYVLEQSQRSKVFKDIERKFTFVKCGGESALPERSGVLDDLIDAVLHSREVEVSYQHFDGRAERMTIQPLSVCICHHQIYIVGRRPDGRLHPFRFSRILGLSEDKGQPFEYPSKEEYDPQRLFSESLGVFFGELFPMDLVEIELHRRWTTYARSHRWHPSQQVEVLGNGTVVVRLRVRVCHELEAWVLGFGDDARVVRPPSLRARVAERLRRAADLYAAQDASAPVG